MHDFVWGYNKFLLFWHKSSTSVSIKNWIRLHVEYCFNMQIDYCRRDELRKEESLWHDPYAVSVALFQCQTA